MVFTDPWEQDQYVLRFEPTSLAQFPRHHERQKHNQANLDVQELGVTYLTVFLSPNRFGGEPQGLAKILLTANGSY
jgi:hypothetical protein